MLGDPYSFQNFTEIMERNIEKIKDDEFKQELVKHGNEIDRNNNITYIESNSSFSPVKSIWKHQNSISK